MKALYTSLTIIVLVSMYAIFNCRSPEESIRSDLPLIRELVKTPRDLEMSLYRDGNNYRLESKDRKETKAVLNQLYNTDHYEKGEPFYGKFMN